MCCQFKVIKAIKPMWNSIQLLIQCKSKQWPQCALHIIINKDPTIILRKPHLANQPSQSFLGFFEESAISWWKGVFTLESSQAPRERGGHLTADLWLKAAILRGCICCTPFVLNTYTSMGSVNILSAYQAFNYTCSLFILSVKCITKKIKGII